MNDRGRHQAAEVARKLAMLSTGIAEAPFVASPLARTRETARIVRRELGLPAEGYATDPRFKEISYGEWEGLTWKEVRRDHGALFAARQAATWDFPPPHGESYAMLATRVAPAIEALPDVSVLVAHGGIARVLLHLLAGMPADEAAGVDIWQGRVLVFADVGHRWH